MAQQAGIIGGIKKCLIIQLIKPGSGKILLPAIMLFIQCFGIRQYRNYGQISTIIIISLQRQYQQGWQSVILFPLVPAAASDKNVKIFTDISTAQLPDWTQHYKNYLWNKAIPELWANQHYYQYFFNTAVPEQTAQSYYYNKFWNNLVPEFTANSFYYKKLWDKAIQENWMANSSNPYRTVFWETMVPAGFGPQSASPKDIFTESKDKVNKQYTWANHYEYYLWNKAVPEDWSGEAGPPIGNSYSYKWTFWTYMIPLGVADNFYTDRFWSKAVTEGWANNYYYNTLITAGNESWAGGYYIPN